MQTYFYTFVCTDPLFFFAASRELTKVTYSGLLSLPNALAAKELAHKMVQSAVNLTRVCKPSCEK